MQPALYRAERPEVFEDIIGQKHIVKILQNQIRTGTVSQAYLFAGTHGTGKTSTARILAKALNCLEGEPGADTASHDPAADQAATVRAAGASASVDLTSRSLPCGRCENCEAIRRGSFVDVIELDAASNNGVDDLRAIIEMVKYPPALGRYKVFIIDEVHMLSTAAENAFLKTLEEPPEYAVFILATTDPQKVRPTIRSRCMELNFRRVTEEELTAGMERICSKRGISAAKDALSTIASRADGSVRDALSILEQCMAAGDSELTRAAVLEYTGAAGEDFYLALTGAVLNHDAGKALIYIDEIMKRGKDAKQILKDWQSHLRDLMIVKYVGRAERIVGASQENLSRLRSLAEKADTAFIEKSIRLISEYINIGRYSERPRILLETAAVRLAESSGGVSLSGQAGTSRSAQPAGITQTANAGRSARTAGSPQQGSYAAAAGGTGSRDSAAGSAAGVRSSSAAASTGGTSMPAGTGASPGGTAAFGTSTGVTSAPGGASTVMPGSVGAPIGNTPSSGVTSAPGGTAFGAASAPGVTSAPGSTSTAMPGSVGAPIGNTPSSGASASRMTVDPSASQNSAPDIPSIPREQFGSPEDMWDRIVREVTAIDRSFLSMVGRSSSVKGFDSGELSVVVSPGKLRFAEDKAPDIARIAKMLYGSDVFVTIRAGAVGRAGAPEVNAGISEAETSGIINEDINMNDVIEDVESLFGIKPTVEG